MSTKMRDDASSKPRLADVATQAGVSVSTVSKVLNGNSDVGDDTRARVNAILTAQRYEPKRKRSAATTVALLVRSATKPSTALILQGALTEARSKGISLDVIQHRDDEPDDGWLDRLRASSTSAIIAVDSTLDGGQQETLARKGIPLVAINPKDAPNEATHRIGATNWAGGMEAAQYLLSLGHTRIAMLRGDDDSMIARARFSGYREALAGAGVKPDPDLVVPGRFTFSSGCEQALKVLDRKARPTAIFAASDQQALGALYAAWQLRIRVPDELSVIGYDDVEPAATTTPPLTTVKQPFVQMGAAAMSMALDLRDGIEPKSHHIELATSLVVRETTAPPAAG